MYEEKSYVGMSNCYFCGGAANILIDRRMRDTLTRNMGVMDMEPCNECKALMKQGVLLMSIKDDTTEDEMRGKDIENKFGRVVGKTPPNPYRTGGWVVVVDNAVKRMFDEKFAEWALKHRFCFITDEAWDAMNLPRGEVEGVSND